MLSRAHRLTEPRDFLRVYRRGTRLQHAFFTIHYLSGAGPTRIGFVVGTKVSRKSTRRNRVKRIVREWVRLHFSQFPSGDYAIVARPGVQNQEADTVRHTLDRLQARLNGKNKRT